MVLCLVKDKQVGLLIEAEGVAEGREEEEEVEEEMERVEVTNNLVKVQTAKGKDGGMNKHKVQEEVEEEMEGAEDRGEEKTSHIIRGLQMGLVTTAL